MFHDIPLLYCSCVCVVYPTGDVIPHLPFLLYSFLGEIESSCEEEPINRKKTGATLTVDCVFFRPELRRH